jgi:hypothetical protein
LANGQHPEGHADRMEAFVAVVSLVIVAALVMRSARS